jgi:hypothetical protein
MLCSFPLPGPSRKDIAKVRARLRATRSIFSLSSSATQRAKPLSKGLSTEALNIYTSRLQSIVRGLIERRVNAHLHSIPPHTIMAATTRTIHKSHVALLSTLLLVSLATVGITAGFIGYMNALNVTIPASGE